MIIGELVAISSGVETVAAIFTCVEFLKDTILKASLRFLWSVCVMMWEDLGGTC